MHVSIFFRSGPLFLVHWFLQQLILLIKLVINVQLHKQNSNRTKNFRHDFFLSVFIVLFLKNIQNSVIIYPKLKRMTLRLTRHSHLELGFQTISCRNVFRINQILTSHNNLVGVITKEINSIPIVYFEKISQERVKGMKLSAKYHNY